MSNKKSGRFPWGESTLGRDIIYLAKKGVDVPTVEAMYRKYVDLIDGVNTAQFYPRFQDLSKDCVHIDMESMHLVSPPTVRFVNSERRLLSIDVGDQITIPLEGLGTFTATAQMIRGGDVLFLFDDYITLRPMNKGDTNAGGYNGSDLKEWISTELYNMFPENLRKKLRGLTIPTVGEICGWNSNESLYKILDGDIWDQFPLMKNIRNRVSYYNNAPMGGWLRNPTKAGFSSRGFAVVDSTGSVDWVTAPVPRGIRPMFWLIEILKGEHNE